jgi:single-stranded-DNA-specific exonuclease
MPIDYITQDLIDQISLLEPFGNGNSKPVFADRNLSVSQANVIGKNKNVFKCTLTNERGRSISAICFHGEEFRTLPCNNGDIVSVIYYPSVNEYGGRKTLQIVMNDIRVAR